jgi:hypothetical protein
MRRTNCVVNASATDSTTMNRFAAMHDWPLLTIRAATAVSTARSRSADGVTMNGSEPPSSSTVFLSAARHRGHRAARGLAAGGGYGRDPRVGDHRFHPRRANQERLEDPRRRSSATPEFLEGEGALRNVRRMLQERNVAGGKGRCGETDDLPEREVPRHDRQHSA